MSRAEHLFTFLDHGHVRFENNLAERRVRPPVIVRKNIQSK
ncbi:MAG: transposase [Phycisphaerae bacterium]